MPVTRTIERNSLSFPNNPHKTYTIPSQLSTQYEEPNGNNPINSRLNQRRASESPRKLNVPSKYLQSTSPNGVSQTQSARRSSTNDVNKQRQSPPPAKPTCTLPTTVCQPGYVTPSKLFNMMGYGLENQYLFIHAHYLYIIDCRSKEKFNENHIITGKNSFISI